MIGHTNGKQFDVFITNHNTDWGWVKLALLPKLEEAGIKVAVADEWLVENGTGYRDFEEGVKDSLSVLAVITPSYCQDMKKQITSMLKGGNSSGSKKNNFIPLVIQKSRLPWTLRWQRPIDLTDPKKEGQNWGKLLARLR